MSPLSRMRKSRDSWKIKNSHKRRRINQLERKVSTLEAKLLYCSSSGSEGPAEWKKKMEEEIQRLKEELREIDEENKEQQREIERLKEELESKKACQLETPGAPSIQVLCVYLTVQCGISFRSVSKILRALIDLGILRDIWVPHFTSVINWTLRVGTHLLNRVNRIQESWIAVMDTSIDLGTRKAVVILRVRLSALQERGKAITLRDCQVIFLKIVERSTGVVIADCLETAFQTAGTPIAILKDGGCDLNKGTLIYREKHHCKAQLGVIADLGHFIANALKAEFAKVVGFKRLLALGYGGAKRLRQTNAAVFVPPKLRTKGRFQGISRLAEWALRILDLMAVQGQAPENSVVASLRRGFPKLPRLRSFIEKFALTCQVMNQLQELLKNNGLNQETYRAALLIMQQLPESSHTRQEVQLWLDRHLGLHCRMSISQIPLMVSSDPIESLMGKLKSVLGRSSIGELNRMTLVLPTLCGEVTAETIALALEETSHMILLKTEKDVIPITLLQQRRRGLFQLKSQQQVPKTSPLKWAS